MLVLQPAGRFSKSWERNQSPWRRELKALVRADMQGGHCSGLASGLSTVLPIVRDRCFVAGNVLRIRE
jgi:hypothetical protein